ncbi:MAG TPA: malto-oligosyltrehalose synthase [Candidatus Limnocylindrales bacterium]|nr:malto-oligosyltrehalose synthase [Candidatus Limnocylindrales bacterium]
MTARATPASTYRLQFNPRFRLPQGAALVPYLASLGVTHVYASPLLGSRRGSPHGYDVTDARQIDRELGGEEAFEELSAALRAHDMGLVLDIVPNHMAASAENAWWRDVLQHGVSSPYAGYFDIDWEPARPGLAERIVVPILEAHYGTVLEDGKLALALGERGLELRYHDRRLPVSPRAHEEVVRHGLEELAEHLGGGSETVQRLRALVDAFAVFDRSSGDTTRLEAELWELHERDAAARAFLDENVRLWNGRPGDPASFDPLDRLLAGQVYRLAFWQVANQELNYRRFFDVSDLVSLHVEDERVFADTHALVLRLAASGRIAGLRVDHVDGLHDPWTYLRRLRERVGPDRYLVVEKILGPDEDLPEDWPVQGTTGYDFLVQANSLFVDPRGERAIDALYRRVSGIDLTFDDIAFAEQRRALLELFGGELRNLASRLGRLAERHRHGRDLTLTELGRALVDVTACLDVYRTYVRDLSVTDRDRVFLERALADARRRDPESAAAVEFLRRALLFDVPAGLSDADRRLWLRFVTAWQQLAGAVMAKGYEDTALYAYARLVSLNEVGGDPATFGRTPDEFHARMARRNEGWPHTMNAGSTHDTKRSEDVRARIDVLSQIPDEWAARVERWREMAAPQRRVVDGASAPDGNTELLLLQTLVGAWPLDDADLPGFLGRMKAYAVKAAREAKRRTSWLRPNAAYEDALAAYLEALVVGPSGAPFRDDLRPFLRDVAYRGAMTSLSALAVRLFAPGVPDVYQGTELWDLSLVDPDNRRPVDFARRTAALAALDAAATAGRGALARELCASWEDGRIKLYVTATGLRHRRARRALFADGAYVPLHAGGADVIAFARSHRRQWSAAVATRFAERPGALPSSRAAPAPSLELPSGAPLRWRELLTGRILEATDRRLALADVLADLPVALLQEDEEEEGAPGRRGV